MPVDRQCCIKERGNRFLFLPMSINGKSSSKALLVLLYSCSWLRNVVIQPAGGYMLDNRLKVYVSGIQVSGPT